MKKLLLSFFLLSTVLLSDVQAQDGEYGRSNFTDRVFFGGGFGMGFGDVSYVNISPIIGYRVSPRFTTALRLMYQYRTYDYIVGSEEKKFSANDYSIGAFATYLVKAPFILLIEYEHLSYEYLYNPSDGSKRRTSFDSALAGGGISQPIGRKVGLFFVVLYNLSYIGLEDDETPTGSPIVYRVGVTAGF